MNDLVDHVYIFCKYFRYDEAKIKLIKAQTKKLLDTKLAIFSNNKYTLAIIIPFKKDIFGN